MNLSLIATNNKKFNEWAKQKKIKLKNNENALLHFNSGYNEVIHGNYMVRASFVCYWEIFFQDKLAKIAPAFTQATLLHALHRALEKNDTETANAISVMMHNFLRVLQNLEGVNDEEE